MLYGLLMFGQGYPLSWRQQTAVINRFKTTEQLLLSVYKFFDICYLLYQLLPYDLPLRIVILSLRKLHLKIGSSSKKVHLLRLMKFTLTYERVHFQTFVPVLIFLYLRLAANVD